MFDIDKIRSDFRVLKNNPDLVYVDSAATSLKPDVVIEAMNEYYSEYPFTVNRGSNKLVSIPTVKCDESRDVIADFLNVSSEEIIFTRSTTASINCLAYSLGHILEKGDEIIVTNLEHHSNFLPWQVLCKEKGLKFKVIKAKNLQIDIEDIRKSISSKTKLIAIHHASNVIGDVVDVKSVCEIARENNIMTLIDGAQAVPHMAVDIRDIGCDFYAFSGHKVLGPMGIGVLYMKKALMNILMPFEYGGDMVVPSSVDYDSYTVKEFNKKFEAGTPSVAEIIGMGEAIRYISSLGMKNIHIHEVSLKKYAIKKLKDLNNKVVLYNENLENGIVIFNILDVSVHDAISSYFLKDIDFDRANIVLRDGQHCNNLTMKYVLKEKAVLRASFYFYNNYKDVDRLVETIEKIYDAWH